MNNTFVLHMITAAMPIDSKQIQCSV